MGSYRFKRSPGKALRHHSVAAWNVHLHPFLRQQLQIRPQIHFIPVLSGPGVNQHKESQALFLGARRGPGNSGE
jgi:hypothetical protein